MYLGMLLFSRILLYVYTRSSHVHCTVNVHCTLYSTLSAVRYSLTAAKISCANYSITEHRALFLPGTELFLKARDQCVREGSYFFSQRSMCPGRELFLKARDPCVREGSYFFSQRSMCPGRELFL